MTTQFQQLQHENSRLKALLREKEEGLVSTFPKSECLNESEEKFRKLFEVHSAVMLVIDPDTGNIIDANQAAASFYGWSVEELQHKSIRQINLLSPEMVMQEMEKSRLQKQTRFVFRHRMSDDSVRDVEVFSNKAGVEGGRIVQGTVVHPDGVVGNVVECFMVVHFQVGDITPCRLTVVRWPVGEGA